MRVDSRHEIAVTASLYETIDTARSLSLYLHLKYATDVESVAFMKSGILPEEYDSAELYGKDYMCFKLLSKWQGWRTGVNLYDKALSEWKSAEVSNLATNARLRSNTGRNGRVDTVLFRAQRKIASILGPCPSDMSWTDHCSWSGGSTADLRRGTSAPQKMTSKLTVTPSAQVCMSHVVGHDPLWFESITTIKLDGPCCLMLDHFGVLDYEVFDTVTKDATTDRTIGKQPTANIYLQKGAGSLIRKRLRRSCVDLDDQTVNQYLCSIAQKLGLCTVDIKSASNALARELVFDLLPIKWANFLDSLRCKKIRIKDEIVPLQMFSAMGNGFTFELESLIFYGLAFACCEELGLCNWYTNVFGDDIIIPADAYALLDEVLAFCGFSVNQSKSFSSGCFYESCGVHYFNGVNVTPIYQKKTTSGRREEYIRFHNRLYRWSKRSGTNLRRQCRLLLDSFRKTFRDKHEPRIPDFGTDDRGFLSDPTHWSKSDNSNGFPCTVYSPTPRFRRTQELPFFSLALRQSSLKAPSLSILDLPSGISSDKKGHAFVSDSLTRYVYRRVKIYSP